MSRYWNADSDFDWQDSVGMYGYGERRRPRRMKRTPAQRIEALIEMAHDTIATEYATYVREAVVTEDALDRLIDEWEAVSDGRKGGRA